MSIPFSAVVTSQVRQHPAYGEDTRRLQSLELTPDMLAGLFRNGLLLRVDLGLPADCEIVRAYYNSGTDVFGVIVRHKSFDIVPSGQIIPKFTPRLSVFNEKSILGQDDFNKACEGRVGRKFILE